MSMQSDIKISQTNEVEDDLIKLSTGVVLRGKAANVFTVISVMAQHPRPKPPVWRDPVMGRDMENYADPDYIALVKTVQAEQTDAVMTVFILSGTELVSKPADLPGPYVEKTGDVDFLDDYALLNLPMLPQSKRWRYLTWVKNIACFTRDDLQLIQEVVGRLSGVSKVDVRAAEDFPRSKEVSG